MQTLIFLIHILSCFLAVHIFRHNKPERYYAAMLFFVNFVGVVFYVIVLFFHLNSTSHPLSQVRSLLQALAWFVYSLPLYKGFGKYDA